MGAFVVRRLLLFVPLVFLISILSFILIQLPPGDYLTSYIETLRASGQEVNEAEVTRLKAMYGLDRPMHIQYFRWISNILLHGNFGRSFQWDRPIADLLLERVPRSMAISILSIIFIWVTSFPIAVYSALNKYSIFDYLFTFLGFIGLAMPNFLLALVLMWLVYSWTGWAVTGLFSPEFTGAPWSWAKLLDLLKNVWLPMVVIGVGGTAGLIRVLRATLLDELNKQYVITARAKGLPKWKLLLKYPIRVAVNPVISTLGWMLPMIISGETIVSIVLNLRTTGQLLLESILTQDMYLAGSIVLVMSTLTVIGTFISDLLLAWLDPRIRYE